MFVPGEHWLKKNQFTKESNLWGNKYWLKEIAGSPPVEVEYHLLNKVWMLYCNYEGVSLYPEHEKQMDALLAVLVGKAEVNTCQEKQ